MDQKKFKIVTLGCRTNQYESQAYRDQMANMGLVEAGEKDVADVCIVNTCTVTDSADQRSRYQIKQLHKHNPHARIFVTGCLAQRAKDDLSKITGVTDVVSNLEKEKLVESIFPDENVPEFAIERFQAHTRAFVKVQDGCNSYCSYCIIPYVRGRSRSKPLRQVLDEVRALVENGYKEIVLTGVNIGDYDGANDPPTRLDELVREVDAIEGLERIRISSIDPDEVDDALLDAVIYGKKTCKSMHIVLQAGSNVVLKRMRRKYTREEFYEATTRLLNAHPDFTFTTDIIVGFPGETERDFEETLQVMNEVKFAKVHMFPYSVRPGTRAARFTNHLPKEVIEERRQIVLRESEKIAYQLREQFVGREMSVLLETGDEGHTDNFLHVKIPNLGYKSNQIVNVKLIENREEGLIGKLCSPSKLLTV